MKGTYIQSNNVVARLVLSQEVNPNARPALAAKLVVARLGRKSVIPELVPAADKLHVTPQNVDEQVAVLVTDGTVTGVDVRLLRVSAPVFSGRMFGRDESLVFGSEEGSAAVAGADIPHQFHFWVILGVWHLFSLLEKGGFVLAWVSREATTPQLCVDSLAGTGTSRLAPHTHLEYQGDLAPSTPP